MAAMLTNDRHERHGLLCAVVLLSGLFVALPVMILVVCAPGEPGVRVMVPPGTKVLVDGEYAGTSSAEGVLIVDGLSPGVHRIRLVKEGFELQDRYVLIPSDDMVDCRIDSVAAKAPVGTASITSLGVNAQGLSEYQHVPTGIILVECAPGSFLMGAPDDQADRAYEEGPQHYVTLARPFLMGKHEVSQDQWKRVMGRNPSWFKGEGLPVENVSWEDCQAFCEKTGLRLPSEAEWEYACRAGTTSAFSFGDTIAPEQVNYDGGHPYGNDAKGLYRHKTVVCGSLPPNSWGLHEMHGNVCEWCQDAWHGNYHGAPRDAYAWDPPNASKRVVRGGSWNSSAAGCQSSKRSTLDGEDCDRSLGFRVALSYPTLPVRWRPTISAPQFSRPSR